MYDITEVRIYSNNQFDFDDIVSVFKSYVQVNDGYQIDTPGVFYENRYYHQFICHIEGKLEDIMIDLIPKLQTNTNLTQFINNTRQKIYKNDNDTTFIFSWFLTATMK